MTNKQKSLKGLLGIRSLVVTIFKYLRLADTEFGKNDVDKDRKITLWAFSTFTKISKTELKSIEFLLEKLQD